MSFLVQSRQVLRASSGEFRGHGVRLVWFVCLAVIWVGYWAGQATAQCASCASKGDCPKNAEKKAAAESVASKEPVGPKWSCPEPLVTVEPRWQGEQIECPFMIRNDGDRNLEIKARGG